MKIGYARVSTNTQSFNIQKDALEKSGCKKIFLEIASGAKHDRCKFKQAISICKKDDTLVVWRLDRLARSTKQLIETVEGLEERGIKFLSLTESLDTRGSVGKLMFNVLASIAQFERDIIKERIAAGLESARLRGKIGGRPKVFTKNEMKIATTLVKDDKITIKDICKHLNISVSTFYNRFKGGRGALEDSV